MRAARPELGEFVGHEIVNASRILVSTMSCSASGSGISSDSCASDLCLRRSESGNDLPFVAGHSVATYGVGQIIGATPVFVAVSRRKHLFLAPAVAVGVAPFGT